MESGVWSLDPSPRKGSIRYVRIIMYSDHLSNYRSQAFRRPFGFPPWPLLQSPSKAKAKAKAKFTKQPNQEDSESLFVGLQIG